MKEGYRRKHLVAKKSKKTRSKGRNTKSRKKKPPEYNNPFDDIFFWINLATTDFSSWLFGNDKGGKK